MALMGQDVFPAASGDWDLSGRRMTALKTLSGFICGQQNPQRSSGESEGGAGFHPLEKGKGKENLEFP